MCEGTCREFIMAAELGWDSVEVDEGGGFRVWCK